MRGQGALKAEIRAAVRKACRVRGDEQAHYEACLRGIWAEPEEDWRWYLDYFTAQGTPAKAARSLATPRTDPEA